MQKLCCLELYFQVNKEELHSVEVDAQDELVLAKASGRVVLRK